MIACFLLEFLHMSRYQMTPKPWDICLRELFLKKNSCIYTPQSTSTQGLIYLFPITLANKARPLPTFAKSGKVKHRFQNKVNVAIVLLGNSKRVDTLLLKAESKQAPYETALTMQWHNLSKCIMSFIIHVENAPSTQKNLTHSFGAPSRTLRIKHGGYLASS